MEINEVLNKYDGEEVKLNIRTLDNGDVLIEGDETSLKFLGELLIAQAGSKDDCGYQISPEGPGSNWFDENSERGIYLHRLPCIDDKHKGGK